MGTDLRSRVRDEEDIKITAYHEAGHTLGTVSMIIQIDIYPAIFGHKNFID